jgi:hypothetical protein
VFAGVDFSEWIAPADRGRVRILLDAGRRGGVEGNGAIVFSIHLRIGYAGVPTDTARGEVEGRRPGEGLVASGAGRKEEGQGRHG